MEHIFHEFHFTMIDRTQTIKSYFSTRNLLGLTNIEKNQIFNLSFEETSEEIFIKNAITNKRLLILRRSTSGRHWTVHTIYPETEALAIYLQKEVNRSQEKWLTKACFKAIEKLFNYDQ